MAGNLKRKKTYLFSQIACIDQIWWSHR